jgi:hypothetical protein
MIRVKSTAFAVLIILAVCLLMTLNLRFGDKDEEDVGPHPPHAHAVRFIEQIPPTNNNVHSNLKSLSIHEEIQPLFSQTNELLKEILSNLKKESQVPPEQKQDKKAFDAVLSKASAWSQANSSSVDRALGLPHTDLGKSLTILRTLERLSVFDGASSKASIVAASGRKCATLLTLGSEIILRECGASPTEQVGVCMARSASVVSI